MWPSWSRLWGAVLHHGGIPRCCFRRRPERQKWGLCTPKKVASRGRDPGLPLQSLSPRSKSEQGILWRGVALKSYRAAAADPGQDNSSLSPLIQSILLPRQLRSSSIAGVAAQSSAATTAPRNRPHPARKRRVGASASREPCTTARLTPTGAAGISGAERAEPLRLDSTAHETCGLGNGRNEERAPTMRRRVASGAFIDDARAKPVFCGSGITSYTWQRRRHHDAAAYHHSCYKIAPGFNTTWNSLESGFQAFLSEN